MADCFIIRKKGKRKTNWDKSVLYEYGTENIGLIGGFYFKGNYLSSAIATEKRSDCIYISNSKSGTCNFLITETSLPINLTEFSSLYAKITCPTTNYSIYSRFSVSKDPISNNYTGYEIISDPIGKIGDGAVVELDISTLSGFYYVNLMDDAGNKMYIYKVWLG